MRQYSRKENRLMRFGFIKRIKAYMTLLSFDKKRQSSLKKSGKAQIVILGSTKAKQGNTNQSFTNFLSTFHPELWAILSTSFSTNLEYDVC